MKTSTRETIEPKLRIAFLLTPRFTLTAFAGFVDALRLAADEGDRSRQRLVRWAVLDAADGPVLSSCSASVAPNAPLDSPQLADFVPGDPVGPKGDRKTKKIDTAGKAFEIRDRESAHLSGRVVAFPHRYFARVQADGKFEIKGVAPGPWKGKIWFADGWAEMPAETVEVTAKREAKVKPITLPVGLVLPSGH